MPLYELILLAVALSMDGFAVSITCGISALECSKHKAKPSVLCALKVSLLFGFFHFVNPLIGWLVGSKVKNYITNFDHWIAFVLLAYIGGKMIFDSFEQKKEESKTSICENRPLLLIAIATSIDALIVGVSLAFLKVDLFEAATVIGLIVFIIAFIGVYLGRMIGSKIKTNFTLIGGIVLIGIGLKILIEHFLK